MNERSNVKQLLCFQRKRIGTGQKHTPDRLRGTLPLKARQHPGTGIGAQGLHFQQIVFNVLYGRHSEFERQVAVQRAEFALMVGAARGHLQKQGVRFIRRAPDCACVMHHDHLKMNRLRAGNEANLRISVPLASL